MLVFFFKSQSVAKFKLTVCKLSPLQVHWDDIPLWPQAVVGGLLDAYPTSNGALKSILKFELKKINHAWRGWVAMTVWGNESVKSSDLFLGFFLNSAKCDIHAGTAGRRRRRQQPEKAARQDSNTVEQMALNCRRLFEYETFKHWQQQTIY